MFFLHWKTASAMLQKRLVPSKTSEIRMGNTTKSKILQHRRFVTLHDLSVRMSALLALALTPRATCRASSRTLRSLILTGDHVDGGIALVNRPLHVEQITHSTQSLTSPSDPLSLVGKSKRIKQRTVRGGHFYDFLKLQ